MAKLSVAAQRVVDNMKLAEGYLTLSQARSNRDAVSELLDHAKIVFTNKDGVDCYKLLGYTHKPKQDDRKGVNTGRRFTFADAGEDTID
jgi:hypothetical protein